jgi:hypothetical protein
LAIHKHPTIDAFDFSLQVKCERREEFNWCVGGRQLPHSRSKLAGVFKSIN